ncbi:MAG: tryptophan 2,3-dioxygenase [Elusimicrobia bacterium]|nr:tryptophan 2,3-dioxygenase [Elusimicrobiota bacterium]
MALTYKTYLQLGDLLRLQTPQSKPPEHDEMLFIVIHQVYELWFKLLLHEFEKIKRDLSAGNLFGAIATFQRARTVMKTLVGQLDVLETMTPMSFTSFRDRLQDSSGFQSRQFRELEFALGYRRAEMLRHVDPAGEDYAVLQSRLKERSVVDHFYDFLETRGVAIPAELKGRALAESAPPNESVQEGIYTLYRGSPDVAILFELMTDFDEGMQEWRYRHVKLVERTIGNKKGTGGSLGVQFLKETLFKPIFPDLWAIRHRL